MTLEKWIFGFLAVAFGGSLLWVFARHQSAVGKSPESPASQASSPMLSAPPGSPGEIAEPVASPPVLRPRSHSGREARIGKSTPVRARLVRGGPAHRRAGLHARARRHLGKRGPKHESSPVKSRG